MSRFQVITAELVAASAAVDSTASALDGGQASVSRAGGALAGTPAAGAYDALVGSLLTTTAGLSTASSGLAAGLITVANRYQQADDAAASGVCGN